jgi:hypothetical protein
MTIPSAIAGLAARFLSAVGAGDAESLAIELRLQVQHLSDRRKQQERDQRDARSLMARLDPETSPEIRAVERELGLVQAGFTEMTSDLRIRAEAAIADATAELARAERAEAAAILASSLGDLGYEVSPIESTLFLQGGAAYFKKTGWDQYCVRLVVRPADEGINFNVIRVITETDETRVESRLADKEIENEWCGDLPQLIDVLSSRGIDLKLTREIPSGALPVPVAKPDEVAALFGVVGRRHFREKRSSSRPSRSKRR